MQGNMKFFIILSMMFFLLGSCATRSGQGCQSHFSARELRQIVDAEIKKRGGEPDSERKSKIEFKRDGCDYLYHEVYLPRRPGSYIFVRISDQGDVKSILPGV